MPFFTTPVRPRGLLSTAPNVQTNNQTVLDFLNEFTELENQFQAPLQPLTYGFADPDPDVENAVPTFSAFFENPTNYNNQQDRGNGGGTGNSVDAGTPSGNLGPDVNNGVTDVGIAGMIGLSALGPLGMAANGAIGASNVGTVNGVRSAIGLAPLGIIDTLKAMFSPDFAASELEGLKDNEHNGGNGGRHGGTGTGVSGAAAAAAGQSTNSADNAAFGGVDGNNNNDGPDGGQGSPGGSPNGGGPGKGGSKDGKGRSGNGRGF